MELCSPLNTNIRKSNQELVLLLNLQSLCALSLYNQTSTFVNIIIAIAALQSIFIIIYHIITYMHGGVIRNKIESSSNAVARWITRSQDKSQNQEFELQDNMGNNMYIYIPQVAFNCNKYREPLIGLDQK